MPTNSAVSGFIQLNEADAIYLSTSEALPPTVCPDLIPGGWGLTDEVLDFDVEGEWIEGYLLRRIT